MPGGIYGYNLLKYRVNTYPQVKEFVSICYMPSLSKIAFCLSLLFINPSWYCPQQDIKPQGYAIIIATKRVNVKAIKDRYFEKETDNPVYGPLSFVDQDLSNVQSILDKAGFSKDNIKTIKGDVRKSEVINALSSLAQKAKKGDLVWIYFTGHGDQIEDKNKDEPDGLDETIVLYEELLVDDEINVLLDKFKPGVRKVLMIDACHSGSAFKLLKSKREVLKDLSDKNFEDERKGEETITAMLGDCRLVRKVPQGDVGKQLIYYGASADDEAAKATVQGSYFTSAIAAKFNTPFAEWRNFTYQTFFCYLRSALHSERNQKAHYMEIGKTDFAEKDHPLKIQ